MTVHELIESLKELPPSATVFEPSRGSNYALDSVKGPVFTKVYVDDSNGTVASFETSAHKRQAHAVILLPKQSRQAQEAHLHGGTVGL